MMSEKQRIYIAIDQKSFYASVECVYGCDGLFKSPQWPPPAPLKEGGKKRKNC